MVFLKKHNIFLSVLLSYITLVFLPYALKIKADRTVLSYSVFSIVLFFCFFFLFKKGISILNKRLLVISVLFGILFAAMARFGILLMENGNIGFDSWKLYFTAAAITPFFAACVCLALYYFPVYMEKSFDLKFLRWFERFSLSKKYFLCIWLFLFVCYFSTLLVYFPGCANYDAVYQIYVFLSRNINNHHPFISTYLFGLFALFGLKICNSIVAGIFVYNLFQLTVTSFVFAYFCKKFADFKISAIMQLLIIAFFSFNYIIIFAAFEMGKDTIFSLLFCLVLFQIYQTAIDNSQFSRRKAVMLVFLVFLMLIFRHNTVFAWMAFLPVFFLGCRKILQKKILMRRIIVFFVFPLILYLAWQGPVLKMLRIPPYRPDIFQCLPMMQVAKVMHDKPEYLSESDKDQIEYFIPAYRDYGKTGVYISDLLGRGNRIYGNADFKILWLKLGLKFPEIYLKAFLQHTAPGWYPGYVDNIVDYGWIDSINFSISRDAFVLFLNTELKTSYFSDSLFYPTLNVHTKYIFRVPVFSLFTRHSIYFWGLLFYTAVCLYYRKYKLLLPGVLMFLYIGTYSIGPGVIIRYSFPLIFSAPLFLVFAVRNCKQNTVNKETTANSESLPNTFYGTATELIQCTAIGIDGSKPTPVKDVKSNYLTWKELPTEEYLKKYYSTVYYENNKSWYTVDNDYLPLSFKLTMVSRIKKAAKVFLPPPIWTIN